MAARLRELEARYRSILFVCSLLDWPWIRDAYQRAARARRARAVLRADPDVRASIPRTLIFVLGELPFITGLYERGRRELTPDDNLSVDGVKEMVLEARDRLQAKLPKVAQRITPQLLSIYFRYVRNLSLIDRRLTPDLYSLIVAAKQTAGDDFALAVAETAREYPYAGIPSEPAPTPRRPAACSRMGIDRAEVPGWGTARMVSRLPGQALSWRTCELRPQPAERDRKRWKQRWDPFGMCSWPPEDDRIESFHRHVRDQAKAILGADLRPLREVHHQRPGRHRHPRDAAELAHRRPLRQGRPARAGARSRSSSSSSTCRPTRRSTPTARPGTPSTPRNRRWPSTPPIP